MMIFALMLLGALVRECGFLHPQSINDLTNIALYFLSPMVILRAFEQPFSVVRFHTFVKLVIGIFIGYLVTIVLAHLTFGRVRDTNLRRILMYSSIYSNNGFMGIPLAQALFGSTGVFYGAASMIGFNVMSWTQGIGMFRQDHDQANLRTKMKQIVLNPNIIAIVVGFLIFVFSVHLPRIVTTFLTYGSNAFTPLSMMIIGSNLVSVKLTDIKMGATSLVALAFRNLIFPAVNLLILWVMHIQGIALLTTVILAACPVAGLVVLFTLQAKGNPRPGVVLMSVSTILSLLTIPLIYGLAAALH